MAHGRPAHVLAGLSTATGRVEMTRDVDPPGADTAALLQRTGLALAGGRVVFGFGGNDGDCATYRGRVVSVPEAGGPPAMFTVDARAGESQGAVWMGGAAPAVDGQGHVLVSAGNGSVYKASRGFDDSDSVLELSPSMELLQYFAPASWASDNSRDLDMSAEPALLPGGRVLIAGKAAIAYLLDGAHLGGIGGELVSTQPVCGANIDGGAAVTGSTVYLPCGSGIVAVRAKASPPGLRPLWSSEAGGGPPIVAGGLVWTISQQRGMLYGLDPRTGHIRQQGFLGGPEANHFPTPSAGAGLLLAPAGNRVDRVPGHRRPGGRPRPGQPRPAGARHRGVRAGRRRSPGGPVPRHRRRHRGGQPGRAGRDRLGGVAPRAEPVLEVVVVFLAPGNPADRTAVQPGVPLDLLDVLLGGPPDPPAVRGPQPGPGDQQPGPPPGEGHAQRDQDDHHHEDHDSVGDGEACRCGCGPRPRADQADPGRHRSASRPTGPAALLVAPRHGHHRADTP